ncbi:uncharacterized protein LOC122620974 isoform X2 [Drosophila teissieri]|uniref:uncharacterized protein LOC122620974 isoform X2 n=1 Tax=Drosophila teissieri TaxID=7243 RepID=UPI001CB9E4D9|nr:uncharacterized protein LOC122620974 isoform X2 [Drosophila teissieri]
MNRTSLSSGSTSRRLPALLFVLLLCLVARTTGRPSTEDEGDLAIIPPDADNVEIHKVKIVNGVMQEDHPVIMYKEDFVSEDYDPTKTETSPSHHKKHKRTRHHHAKQVAEKKEDQILFDILPDKPIVLEEDLKALPPSKVEAAQLAEPIKEEWLAKHPKKYHSRQRREVPESYEKVLLYYGIPHVKWVPPLSYSHIRYSVKGKKPHLVGPPNRKNQVQQNIPIPDSVNSRGEFDLFHNSNQADADNSIYNRSSTTTPSPVFQVNDSDFAELVPLAGFSPPVFTPPIPGRRPSSRKDPFQFPQDIGYQENSKCQRASRLCCSQRNIGSQYDCFHHHGCSESISTIISTCS